MFEEILGLPLHPLAVHAPIVLVPLLVLASIGYALVPKKRGHVAWVAAILAVLAPGSAAVAKLSGDAFGERTYGDALPDVVVTHSTYGNRLLVATIVTGVLTLGLIWVRRGQGGGTARTWLTGALTVLVVAAAVVSAVFVFQVGHSGAEMVWQGR